MQTNTHAHKKEMILKFSTLLLFLVSYKGKYLCCFKAVETKVIFHWVNELFSSSVNVTIGRIPEQLLLDGRQNTPMKVSGPLKGTELFSEEQCKREWSIEELLQTLGGVFKKLCPRNVYSSPAKGWMEIIHDSTLDQSDSGLLKGKHSGW